MPGLRATAALASALAFLACSRGQASLRDDRLVVFGPSLVSLMIAGGLDDLIVGADRYSLEAFPSLDAVDVGGYLDPSFETIASLAPTSIHVAGSAGDLADLASALGAGYHRYSFDRLQDVLGAMDSLSARYSCSYDTLRADLSSTLDSIADTVPEGISLSVVVFHEPGEGSMTLAGRETFIGDLVQSMGIRMCAPEAGAYPSVSAEGMVDLSPDYVFLAFPGRSDDSIDIETSEREFWSSLGFDSTRVDCGFGADLLVPGAGMAATARRVASGICSN